MPAFYDITYSGKIISMMIYRFACINVLWIGYGFKAMGLKLTADE